MELYRLFFKRYIRIERPQWVNRWALLGLFIFIGASVLLYESSVWIITYQNNYTWFSLMFIGACLFLFFTLKSRYTLFFSLSTFGIFIGTAALTVVLLLFDRLETKYHSPFEQDVLIVSKQGQFLERPEELKRIVQSIPEISNVFLYLKINAVEQSGERVHTLYAMENLPNNLKLSKREALALFKEKDSLTNLKEKRILYGPFCPEYWVSLILPQADISPFGAIPRTKTFSCKWFSFGNYLDYSYTHMDVLQDFVRGNPSEWVYSGLHVQLVSSTSSHYLSKKILEKIGVLGSKYKIEQYRDIETVMGQALNLEKKVALVISFVFGMVAILAIVSSGFMLAVRKKKSIAILKTLGALDKQIFVIFFQLGCLIGILGGVLGVLGGWGMFVCIAKAKLFSFVELLPDMVKVNGHELLKAGAIGVFLGLIGILFPSLVAANTPLLKGLKD